MFQIKNLLISLEEDDYFVIDASFYMVRTFNSVMVQLEKSCVRQQKGIKEVRSQGGPSFYSCVLLNKCCICLPNAINSF